MKRSLDDSSTAGATTKDLFDGLLTTTDALPPSLKGLTVSCAGPLIYAEDAKYTFHLGPAVLAELIDQGGGTFSGAINGNTDIVVIGMLEKEWTQKQAVRTLTTQVESAS